MENKDELTRILKEKVTDFKRFAFILVALSVFLFIGLLVPNEGISSDHQLGLIALSCSTLFFAFIFHKKAMQCQEELYSNE